MIQSTGAMLGLLGILNYLWDNNSRFAPWALGVSLVMLGTGGYFNV